MSQACQNLYNSPISPNANPSRLREREGPPADAHQFFAEYGHPSSAVRRGMRAALSDSNEESMKKQLWIPFLGLLWALLACNLPPPPPNAAIARQSSVDAAQTTPAPTGTSAPTRQIILSQGGLVRQTALPTPTAAHTVTLTCRVNAEALNVRPCAGLTCAPVAWLYAGEVATLTQLTQTGADWLQVEVNVRSGSKVQGYIKAAFCEVQP
jgi:hypothetical protein